MPKKRKETRAERIDRLKNHFRHLSPFGKVRELVRYNRALRGEIAPPLGVPKDFLIESHEALKELVLEEIEPGTLGQKLAAAKSKSSRPFTDPPDDD